MIDKATVNRIIDTANIVDVVGDFVSLKRRGSNYIACCPFHDEKTPSFSVSPARNIYKCFGCGKGGNTVSFVMEHEHLSYVEALRYLAKKYSIDIVEKELTEEEVRQNNDRESMMIVSSYAQQYFTNTLHKHAEGKSVGLSYFKERGFTPKTIEKFQLGYCLDSRSEFSNQAVKDGYKAEFLVKTGLSVERNDTLYDRFFGRVLFPIHSLSGRVIGFGGRTLKADKTIAKYLNSPESEIYVKSKSLYGIFFAKQAIAKFQKCYLVEGYTDVISMAQNGIENVVASSGTSLTTDQIKLIRRFTTNVTVLYDGDAAGIKASLRGIDMLLEEGMNIKVVLLPDGDDPDSFARKHSTEELLDFLDKSEEDFLSFKIRLLLSESRNDPLKKAEVISDVVRSISVIPDNIIRTVYLKECSRLMGVEEDVLGREIQKLRRKKFFDKESVKPVTSTNNNTTVVDEPQSIAVRSAATAVTQTYWEEQEKDLVVLLLKYGNSSFKPDGQTEMLVSQYLIPGVYDDGLELQQPMYARLFNEYKLAQEEEGVGDPLKSLLNHADRDVCELVVNLLSEPHKESKIWEKNFSVTESESLFLSRVIPKTLKVFKAGVLVRFIDQLKKELQTAIENKEEDKMKIILQKIGKLNEARKELSSSLERIM